MTRVVALVAFSTGAITMEEKSVYEVDDALATDLIAQGLCADAATYFGGGGSGGGVLVVTDTEGTLNKTWQEIHDAMLVGGAVVGGSGRASSVLFALNDARSGEYRIVITNSALQAIVYKTSSASGYPVIDA